MSMAPLSIRSMMLVGFTSTYELENHDSSHGLQGWSCYPPLLPNCDDWCHPLWQFCLLYFAFAVESACSIFSTICLVSSDVQSLSDSISSCSFLHSSSFSRETSLSAIACGFFPSDSRYLIQLPRSISLGWVWGFPSCCLFCCKRPMR